MRTKAGVIAVVVGVVGCGDGGDGSTDARNDGPPAPDAAPDASPDARLDAAPPGVGEYVMSAVQVPTTSAQVQSFGMDLDSDQPNGDPGIDNQLGSVLAGLSSMDIDAQRSTTAGIDRGTSIDLFWYEVMPGGGAALWTYEGENPNPPACDGPSDTVCRHHLDGTAGFDIPSDGVAGFMPATDTGSPITGGPGTASVQLAVFGDSATSLPLVGARFTGTIDADGIMNGKLAGAIPAPLISTEIIPGLGESVRAAIMEDCPSPAPPDCNCALGSTGESILSTFDEDDDCTVSNAELENDPIIQGFLAPDTNINGQDALSFGFLFTAVPASFTPPP